VVRSVFYSPLVGSRMIRCCSSKAVKLLFALALRKNSASKCPLAAVPKEVLMVVLREWMLAGGHWELEEVKKKKKRKKTR
jgi:hypothetical protein